MTDKVAQPESFEFKAEIRQLLNILIHSLYTDREIFLRELISNASDALNRFRIVQLTEENVLDPEAELRIHIETDEDNRTITISDTGVGMTHDEFVENLGTIAHSGAAAFLEKLQDSSQASDVIGQFGVGFYSVFMVAEQVEVTSRSYDPETSAWAWRSSGGETYDLLPADKETRGTKIVVTLKEDAGEFAKAYKVEQAIRTHSNFVTFPIYVNDKEEPANQRTALWRESPSKVDDEEANNFYRQMTLDFEPPLHRIHMRTDVPVQLYALLFIPASTERSPFSPRQEDGIKLYSRKVLIDDYYKDMLPQYFRFVQGVVDSEDLPLNVSREMVQRTPVMNRLKQAVTNKALSELKKLADKQAETYAKFWETFGSYMKEGVATDPENREKLLPLLRFHSSKSGDDGPTSLYDYIARMNPHQKKIYFILGNDLESVAYSPHLDPLKRRNIEVLYLVEAIDSFMLMGLKEFEDYPLQNVASADLELPDVESKEEDAGTDEPLEGDDLSGLVERIKSQLGERVSDVRTTGHLVGSPVRLVDPEGTMNQEMQRVQRILGRDYEVPKKILEINPRHTLLHNLAGRDAADPLAATIIEQLYASALLVEGLHPNPAEMVGRIQKLMEQAAGIANNG